MLPVRNHQRTEVIRHGVGAASHQAPEELGPVPSSPRRGHQEPRWAGSGGRPRQALQHRISDASAGPCWSLLMSSQSLDPVIPLKLHLAFGDPMAPPSIQGPRSCRENPPWDVPAGLLRRRECRPTLPAGGVGGTGGGPVSHGWLLGTQDLSPPGSRPRRHPGSLRQAHPAAFPGSLQDAGPPKEERPRRPTPAPSFPQCGTAAEDAEAPERQAGRIPGSSCFKAPSRAPRSFPPLLEPLYCTPLPHP